MNYGGCLAQFEGKTDGSGCGFNVEAREECQYEACLKNCPWQLDPDGQWTFACRMSSFDPGGQCNSEAMAAWCEGDFIGTPGGICQWSDTDTFLTVYTRIAKAFCE
jgi:hypothetical protein